ncbi:MAG: putative Ig domain-containing protein [Verrucomicrobia bacterium]|nr:putative Ig domain-containing protein [Verrucomicrobiota bacterium]
MYPEPTRFFTTLFLCALLTACGGGGSSSSPSATPNSPTTPTTPTVSLELHYATTPWFTVGKPISSLSPRIDSSFSNVTFKVENGTLPPGLNLAANGIIAGTPSTAGVYVFTIHANSGTQDSRLGITATIESADTLTLVYDAPALPLNAAISPIKPALSGNTPGVPTAFAIISGVLPLGLQLNTDGSLSGTPTTAGTFTPTIKATQGTRTATSVLYILVRPPGRILPRGYFFVQEVACYNTSKYGAISTAAEAETLFSEIEGLVNGVEYTVLYYDKQDLAAHTAVAQVAKAHHVDLWASSGMIGKARAFGPWPTDHPDFQAYSMTPDGTIIPAVDSAGNPIIDRLNPEAMNWLISAYRTRFLEPSKGLLAGIFFNEDAIPYLEPWANNKRYNYWSNASYSPSVLKQWQAYCVARDVKDDAGLLVTKFPVHLASMVASGGGQTHYCAGYDVPTTIKAGDYFTQLPQAKGVWKHWYDFLGRCMLDNWIGHLATVANAVNADNPDWRGTMYFGLNHWSLPYEQIQDPSFTVPAMNQWGAWGRQRGVDLQAIALHPELDHVICETYPKMAANLEFFAREFQSIAEAGLKTFGVMFHRDDNWSLSTDEEAARWQAITRLQPTIITRYPRVRMLPTDPFYNDALEKLFQQRLKAYQQGLPIP